MNNMHHVVILAVLACSQIQINADTDGEKNNADFIICGFNETYKEEFFNQGTKMKTDFKCTCPINLRRIKLPKEEAPIPYDSKYTHICSGYFESYKNDHRCEENNICKVVTKMVYGQEKLGTQYVDSVERTCRCKETMKCVKSDTDRDISPGPPDDQIIAEYYRCKFSVCTKQNRFCYIVAHVNPVLNITYCRCNGECIFKGPVTEYGVLHHYYQCFPDPTPPDWD